MAGSLNRNLSYILLPLLAFVGLVWVIQTRVIPLSRQIGEAEALVKVGEPKLELINEVLALEGAQQELDKVLWKGEKDAQKHEEILIQLWDKLKEESDKIAVLESFPLSSLFIGTVRSRQTLDSGINRLLLDGNREHWDRATWLNWLGLQRDHGFSIENTEWRHVQFTPAQGPDPARSKYWFSVHGHRAFPPQRFILRGGLDIAWEAPAREGSPPRPLQVKTENLELLTDERQPAFARVFNQALVPEEKTFFIDPVLIHDLDGNGLNDVILAAKNLVLLNRGAMKFEPATLWEQSPGLIYTAVLGDFSGDGITDFLCADRQGLLMIRGHGGAPFRSKPERVWQAPEILKYVQVLNAGDVDNDHDLDLYLGQYKLPYKKGQMPTPYYDANDGHPSWLLLNEGGMGFVDATDRAGLKKKGFRRLYSSSFFDMDGDGDLDLLNVSDFAGLDLYENLGNARFEDVTREKVDETHAFGMAHGITDLNGDGRLDFFMIGMNSSAASRLDHLGLTHPEKPDYATMRAPMTYGNRFYLGTDDQFLQAGWNNQVASSGWSWGADAFDFENDGDLDIYIVNGHESFASVKDYESHFWRHDIYLGTSEDNPVLDLYYNFMSTQLRGGGMSYGGYEKNRFYIRHDDVGYIDAAHLMGIGLEKDSRNLIADDLDKDGRMDLVCTTFEAWPVVRQTVQIFHNQGVSRGEWIGLELGQASDGCSPIGAVVWLHSKKGRVARTYVTGASYRSQGSPSVHFGLGKGNAVDRLEVRWVCGETFQIERPEPNQWHRAGRMSNKEERPDVHRAPEPGGRPAGG